MAQKARISHKTAPPLVSKGAKEMKARPRSSKVAAEGRYGGMVGDAREEPMETDSFNGDEEVDYSGWYITRPVLYVVVVVEQGRRHVGGGDRYSRWI